MFKNIKDFLYINIKMNQRFPYIDDMNRIQTNCENCDSMKILCNRRVPISDTVMDFPYRGSKCHPLLQKHSTKHLNDLKMWKFLNQTRP